MSASAREARAFDAYVELGPERNLSQLASVLRAKPGSIGLRRGPSLRTLESWSAKFGWQNRLMEIERHAREEADRQHVEQVKQHRERLRQEGLFLQQRGLEWLRSLTDDSVSAHEAIRAIETGFKLEALAIGEVTERIQLEERDERLERLSDEELEGLIRKAREDEPGSPTGKSQTIP